MKYDFDNMPEDDLFDLLDGFWAYDSGAVDSGINDDVTKFALFEWLHGKDKLDGDSRDKAATERAKLLDRYCAWGFFSEEAMNKGYGLADCRSFIRWLSDNGYDV